MANLNTPAIIPEKHVLLPVLLCLLAGVVLAYFDQVLLLNTLLLETVHALVVMAIFVACLVYERKYPHIRQFGWSSIVWGMAFLMVGATADILDDQPAFVLWGVLFPFGPSWQVAFVKKTLGYTVGIALFAYGFFRWIPWMINTRLDIHRLNLKLSNTNRNLNRTLMSLDEHVESERLTISRELHDDVAQQLTYAKIQLQLYRKALESDDPARVESARHTLEQVGTTVSEALKSIRQISGDLRPESLFSIGLIPALEQFLEKLQQQYPETSVTLAFFPLDPQATHTRIEKVANDQQLLHLFRVIQEGTRNALKHAEARTIRIVLRESALDTATADKSRTTRLQIRIEDDGKGLPWKEIPPDDALIAQGHLGIVGLKERVKALEGEFSLFIRPDGPGSCLEIRIV
jgi:signal transduction histidine kinase